MEEPIAGVLDKIREFAKENLLSEGKLDPASLVLWGVVAGFLLFVGILVFLQFFNVIRAFLHIKKSI